MRVWSKTYVYVWSVVIIGILPFFSQNSSFALEIALQWDANGEPDLAGYEIFYKSDSSGAPYSGTEADQGDSPIIVPLNLLADQNNPEYTLTGLPDGEVYFLAVKAYDTEDLRSDFSNEVSATPQERVR